MTDADIKVIRVQHDETERLTTVYVDPSTVRPTRGELQAELSALRRVAEAADDLNALLHCPPKSLLSLRPVWALGDALAAWREVKA